MISYVDSGMSNLRNNFRRREDSIFYPGNSAASFTRRRGLSQCYLCNSFAAKIQEYLVLLHAAASRLRCYGNLGFPPILTLVTRLLVIVSKARRREDFGCYMSNNLAAGLGPPLLVQPTNQLNHQYLAHLQACCVSLFSIFPMDSVLQL